MSVDQGRDTKHTWSHGWHDRMQNLIMCYTALMHLSCLPSQLSSLNLIVIHILMFWWCCRYRSITLNSHLPSQLSVVCIEICTPILSLSFPLLLATQPLIMCWVVTKYDATNASVDACTLARFPIPLTTDCLYPLLSPLFRYIYILYVYTVLPQYEYT